MARTIERAVEELWGCRRTPKRASAQATKARASRVLFEGWAVVQRVDGRIVDFCPVESKPHGRRFVGRAAKAKVPGWSTRRVVVVDREPA